VVIIAGNSDTFSDVYLKSNKDNFKCGIPLNKIYPIIKNRIPKVKKADALTTNLVILLNLRPSF
jgi:hypothetical protein